MKKLGFVFLVLCLLSGCSSKYASNGEQMYKFSHNGEKLVVPPPLSSANISYFYNLPEQNQDPSVRIVPPVNGEAA